MSVSANVSMHQQARFKQSKRNHANTLTRPRAGNGPRVWFMHVRARTFNRSIRYGMMAESVFRRNLAPISHKMKKRDCDCSGEDKQNHFFLFFFFLVLVHTLCLFNHSPVAFHPPIFTFITIPTEHINMSPSKTSAAANAAAEALQNDQAAFHKHLQELSTMVKEIEAKLKPTIKK